jgi:2,5-dihydroxypyridine 5,6-dioxygenase
MRDDRVQWKWVECFAGVFARCGVKPGEVAAILSESQSRAINVELAELALESLGATVFHISLPTPRLSAPVPVRSTGASHALQGIAPVVESLAKCGFIADLTVEGLLHAPELGDILKGGARIMVVSNEHPEILERTVPDPALEPKVRLGMRMLKSAREMHVTSPHGSDLRVALEGARVGGIWGYTEKPGTITNWPGGLCLAFPRAGAANGRLVLAPGDINLTFKRYLETPVTFTIVDDYITAIDGDGIDAALTRDYLAAWNDPNAAAVSHVGWGMNPGARWVSGILYDKDETNGTEQRAFAGNFLYSTGANETANRFTLGHFDIPMRNCSVSLDGKAVVTDGALVGELA